MNHIILRILYLLKYLYYSIVTKRKFDYILVHFIHHKQFEILGFMNNN